MLKTRPSRVFKLRVVPQRASASGIRAVWMRCDPSRAYVACSFSPTINWMSAGITPGASSPSPSKVTVVPFFQPADNENNVVGKNGVRHTQQGRLETRRQRRQAGGCARTLHNSQHRHITTTHHNVPNLSDINTGVTDQFVSTLTRLDLDLEYFLLRSRGAPVRVQPRASDLDLLRRACRFENQGYRMVAASNGWHGSTDKW